jgi:alkylation response protein AidB-like acyl-CoA dehydrogenase
MSFAPTEDQQALRKGARELCTRLYPMEAVRAYESGSFDRSLWRELTGSGMFALHLSEAAGGVGLGRTELAMVFQELGRALVPGPVVGTAISSGHLDLAKPDDVVGLVTIGTSGPVAIEHPAAVDWLVLLGPDEVRLADRAALNDCTLLPSAEPLDPLTPYRFSDRLPNSELLGGPDLAAQLRRDGALLVAAQAAGIAAATMDRAVRYALEREQFGRAIGSFQAVKHLLADMRVRADLAQVAVEAAAVLVDEGDPDAAAATSSAKVVAGEAAVENGRTCVQVHGGMGFAWEVDAHLYQKRAWVLDQMCGSRNEHARRLSRTWPADERDTGESP